MIIYFSFKSDHDEIIKRHALDLLNTTRSSCVSWRFDTFLYLLFTNVRIYL